MGKHKLLMPSEQMLVPFKTNKEDNPVDPTGSHHTADARLCPRDPFVPQQANSDDNKAKPRTCGSSSPHFTTPRSSVFPANYTQHAGKPTTKVARKSGGATLSPSCLFPSEKRDKKMAEIPPRCHSLNAESNEGAKPVRRKALCRREYAIPRRKSSVGTPLSHAKTAQTRPASQNPGSKSLLVLIERTMKEIDGLHRRQEALCDKQLSRDAVGCPRDVRGFRGLPVKSEGNTPASETRVDDKEE